MNLNTHFTLEQLLRSDTATRLGLHEQFKPGKPVLDNLTALCTHVLQPLKNKGLSLYISSGYRCPRLNQAVGGAGTSQHLLGQAADISAAGYTTEELYQFIKKSGLPFDQLIQEFDRWVHISYNPARNRGQCLRATRENGKVVYQQD